MNRFWLHVTKLGSARTRPAGCQCTRHTGLRCLRARVAFTTPVCVCARIFSFLKPSVSLINALTHFLVFSTRVFGVSARACTPPPPHTHTLRGRDGAGRVACLRLCVNTLTCGEISTQMFPPVLRTASQQTQVRISGGPPLRSCCKKFASSFRVFFFHSSLSCSSSRR